VILFWIQSSYAFAGQHTPGQQALNVSSTPRDSQFPSVVADPAGSAHIVWCESVEGSGCDTIYYTQCNDGNCSSPLDIVFSPGQSAEVPVLGIDRRDRLVLVWLGGGKLLYTYAYAHSATSARNWALPAVVEGTLSQIGYPDLAVDTGNNLHLVFTSRLGDGSGIYYSQLLDGQEMWTEPIVVFENTRMDRMVDRARLAVDERGGIHVIWTEYDFPDTFPPEGIRYSRSYDAGGSWSDPIYIDGPYDFGGITTIGGEEVHLFWSGAGENRHKFHQWSEDRGVTWFPAEHTLEIGGYQGWPGMDVDGEHNIHLVQVASPQSSDEHGETLYYQLWERGDWSPPSALLPLPEGAPNHAYNPEIAIGLGNEVHVVVSQMKEYSSIGADEWAYDIYYLYWLADLPRQEPRPLQMETVVSVTVPASHSDSIEEESDPTFPRAFEMPTNMATGPRFGTDPLLAVIVGVLPALALAVGVVLSFFIRRNRK
jgi:hypothetical protein